MKQPNFPMALLERYLDGRRDAMLALLRELVVLESPSHHPPAVERLARRLAREWRARRAHVRLLRTGRLGPILRAELRLGRGSSRGQLLVLGHLDTVYGMGILRQMPFRLRRDRAYGPGTFDMKSGLVQALFAAEALGALHLPAARKLVFLFTSDEEIGSAAGRPVVEREARRSAAVLVVEPATGLRGALKTARKGVGEFELIVHGHAAHAGVEPEKGVNAVHELARQIQHIQRLARPRRGLTLNVDVVEGGTRTNVIPARASARIDVRIPRLPDGPRIERRLGRLQPLDRRAHLELRGGINRPPLERTAAVRRLFRHAQQLGHQLGIELEESSTGGASDGNFTAALGVPTLDGLGGVGAGAHSPGEFVLVRRMPERAALLAGLLLTL
jgi:glutamate carboxypeptidase